MQIFLSYSSVDRELADQINLAMLGSGHSVFFDKESLPPAGDYQTKIRKAVADSDFLVFLISPESVKKGSFALTELGYARKKWKHPRGKVLPVMVRTVAYENIPTYLKAVTVLEPEGNVAAEVASAIPSDASMTDGPSPPLQASMVERTIRVPDQPPVRQSWGSGIVAAAVIAVVLIGGAEWYLEVEKLVKSNKTWFRDWLFAPGVIWKLIIAALAMLAMAAWISVSIASNWRPGGGTAVERLKLAFVSTTVWFFYAGPLIIFVFALVAQYCSPEEPLPFFSGIGIWAGEMLRMVAFMLAIFFMFKAGFDLRANGKKIEAEFCFAPLPLTRFRWRDLGIGFEHWQMREYPRTSRFSAEEAWHAYLCRNKFWPRFIRIGVLFALYLLFSFAIYKLFPPPLGPFRGDMAFKIDRVVSLLSGASLLLLSFYVADAIQLNSNFTCVFGREVTKWGRSVVDRSHRSPPLTEEELSAYHESFFVAQRTQVVAPLIWYPLLVLTLLIIARSSFSDNSLFLICSITAAWAVGSAISLRRAAEILRYTSLNELRRFRLLGLESEAKRETFDELIAEIRGLKTGAFAPLTDQPFIRAVLFPGVAVGLLAVRQRLLDIF